MNRTRYLAALCAAVLPLTLAVLANGCSNKDDDTPAPVTSVAPPPVPTPTPATSVALVPEEDAGSDAGDAGDAGDAAAKVGTGTGDPTGMRKCCTALRQNANSAPPEQKASYLSAAGICDGLVNSPQGRQALGAVRSALLGAKMPAACQ
jgi:hypothetical protein